MKKIVLLTCMVCSAQWSLAQDTYDMQRLSGSDLTGTSRYVGMGGAMGALGGDLSALGSNPAGLGIYRSNDVAATYSLNLLNNGSAQEKSRSSLDQFGVAIATHFSNVSDLKYINFGFNYQKHKNFFDDFSVANNWNGQFSQTFELEDLTFGSTNTVRMPVLPAIAVAAGILTGEKDAQGELSHYAGQGAYNTYYDNYQVGGIQEFNFSMAANLQDKYFLGASVGFYHADFDRGISYTEHQMDSYSYDMYTYYTTSGTGVDLKLGAIIRPFDESNFRVGLALHSPVFYSLTDENGVEMRLYDQQGKQQGDMQYCYVDPVDYTMTTPWKVNLSVGNTFGNKLALGAEYQLEDYSAIRQSTADGYWSEFSDYVNASTRNMLRMVHTFKLGAEWKVTDQVSLRAGYNFMTSPIHRDAYRDLYGFANDIDISTLTETSYANDLALHRLTCGLGYRGKHLYADVAFQYTRQKADFYAFDDYDANTGEYLPATSLSKDRSSLSFTLGYRF